MGVVTSIRPSGVPAEALPGPNLLFDGTAALDWSSLPAQGEIGEQKYGASLTNLYILGNLAVNEALDTTEGINANQARWDDWSTQIGEMLKTDKEMMKLLEVNRFKEHQINGGQVLASDRKTPMVKVIRGGVESSANAAETEARMSTQAERDKADEFNALRVDEMAAGETSHNTRLVVSMYPVEAMERDGKEFWNDMSYTEGLAYVQSYHLSDEGKLVTGTHSINFADKDLLREVLEEEFGLVIPAAEHTNNWVKHGMEVTLDDEAAAALPIKLREAYYKKLGWSKQALIVEKLMSEQLDYVSQVYQELDVQLSKAAFTREKNPAIHEFASTILINGGDKLSPKVRSGLIRVCNREKFDEADGRLIDFLVRYGVVEHIREHAQSKISSRSTTPRAESIPDVDTGMGWFRRVVSHPGIMQQIIIKLGGRVVEGADAGRDYGGCPGVRTRLHKTTKGREDLTDLVEGPQEAFGGRDVENEEGSEEASWHGGKLHFFDRCRACSKFRLRTGACHICKNCVDHPPEKLPGSEEKKEPKKVKAAVSIGPLVAVSVVSGLDKR